MKLLSFMLVHAHTPTTGMGAVINSYGMDRCAAAIKLAENKMVKIKTNAKEYKAGPGSPRIPSPVCQSDQCFSFSLSSTKFIET